MKKLGLLVMPLMAISLLASCNKGGGDNPGKVKFSLSSDKPVEVADKIATVYIDWTPTNHTIKFESFTYTCEPSIENNVTFEQAGDPRPMPVTITFEKDITEDISGTLSFTYKDVTAKTKGESEINVNIPIPGETSTTIDISIPEEANDYTFEFEYTLKEGCTLEVDWGDDNTTNEEASHTYSEPGDYEITIDNITNLSLYDMPGHNYAISICLGSYITSIGWSSFSGCNRLTSIDIPNTVTSIGANAFILCSALTSVIIPSGVTSIEFNTFYNCSSLTSVDIRGNVTTIGDAAFYSCSSLTSINIPNSVTYIAGNAFNSCSSLTYNAFDNALYLGPEINKYMLLIKAKDIYIESCEINGNCKFIGDGAFTNCSDLASISIPNSVTSIGGRAFLSCFSLTEMNLKQFGNEDEIPICGDSAFAECPAILEVASIDMANKFKDSDKGWPDSLDLYHWPGKPENSI